MPTSNRTTIKATIQEFATKLRSNLVANPPTAVKPFRRGTIGEVRGEEFARPYMAVTVTKSTLLGTTDGDKLIEIAMTLKLVTDVAEVDGHDRMLDQIGAVDDYLDSIIHTGVQDGAAGFDDREWTIGYSATTSGPRLLVASAKQTCVVTVQRGFNRAAAP